jgi:hypothetical protein
MRVPVYASVAPKMRLVNSLGIVGGTGHFSDAGETARRN